MNLWDTNGKVVPVVVAVGSKICLPVPIRAHGGVVIDPKNLLEIVVALIVDRNNHLLW